MASRLPQNQSYRIDTWIVPANGGPVQKPSMAGLCDNRDTVPGIEHFGAMICKQGEMVSDRVAFAGLPQVNVSWLNRGYRSGIATFEFGNPKSCDYALLLSRKDPEGDAVVTKAFWQAVKQVHPDLDLVPPMAQLQATTSPLCVVVTDRTGAERPAGVDFIELCFAFAFAWIDGERPA